MSQKPNPVQCEARTASDAQCGRKTTNRPPDCGQHPLPADDPRLREFVGLNEGDPVVIYAAPEWSDGTDTPLPLGCGVITVSRGCGYHKCDECGTLGKRLGDISDHVRREHIALPAFGPVADSIRRQRAASD